jgi:predicted enzyme related to lactoylglutathione lyase
MSGRVPAAGGVAARHGRFVATRLIVIACAALSASCVAPVRIDTSAMSFAEQPLLGKVVWNDLITEDAEAARRFYGGLFGWSFQDATGPGGRAYVLAKSGAVYVAGFVPVARPADGTHLSRWLPYVSVADVDDTVRRATSAGASVAVAARNVGLGRVAAIVDPEGAVIGLARSRIGDPDDATTAPAAGQQVWTELLADDPDAESAFYRDVFGYEARTIERRGGQYTLLTQRGVDRAGILKNPTQNWRPLWLTSFGVADPAASAAQAATLGGKVLLVPTPEIRDGTIAVVEDPSGAVLVLQKLVK